MLEITNLATNQIFDARSAIILVVGLIDSLLMLHGIEWDEETTINGEEENICKKICVVYLKVLSRHSLKD
jgi:hypothetical protein